MYWIVFVKIVALHKKLSFDLDQSMFQPLHTTFVKLSDVVRKV